MSNIAILVDFHVNLLAYAMVLREGEQCGVATLVFLGEIVGYGTSQSNISLDISITKNFISARNR